MKKLLILLFITAVLSARAQNNGSARLQYRATIDSLSVVNRNLKADLFLAKYKIEKVKYYLAICQKNKSQEIFLKGWIKRAVE